MTAGPYSILPTSKLPEALNSTNRPTSTRETFRISRAHRSHHRHLLLPHPAIPRPFTTHSGSQQPHRESKCRGLTIRVPLVIWTVEPEAERACCIGTLIPSRVGCSAGRLCLRLQNLQHQHQLALQHSQPAAAEQPVYFCMCEAASTWATCSSACRSCTDS